MQSTAAKKKPVVIASGPVKATVPGFALVEVPEQRRRAARPAEPVPDILPRLAKALNSPGISRDALFKTLRPTKRPIYAYSVDPSDITRFVRETEDGRKTIGRMVGGRFVPLKAA